MRTRLFQMRISGIEVGNPYRPCTTGKLHLASWGGVTSKISLVLVHFGLIKLLKTKAKYNCISNILYLLSALACIPRVEAVWASLVVFSPSFSKFSICHQLLFDCWLEFSPSRALTRSFEVSNPSTWTYFCYMSNAIDHGCGTMGLWQPLSSHRGRAFLRETFLYFAN